jgi:hypothetical protein
VKRCGICRQIGRYCSRTPWLVLGRLKVPCPREACWRPPLRLSQTNSGYQNETSVLACQEEVKGEQAMTIQDAMNKAVEGALSQSWVLEGKSKKWVSENQ